MTASKNPCGLRGLAFAMLAAPDPDAIHRLLLAFGFSRTQHHPTRAIDLYEQGSIVMLLDRARSGFAVRFTADHGPCICALGWTTDDADEAAQVASRRGARLADGDPQAVAPPDAVQIVGHAGILRRVIGAIGGGQDAAAFAHDNRLFR